MAICYRLHLEQIASLAGHYKYLANQSSDVLRDLASRRVYVNHYEVLTKSEQLAPVAEQHYDALLLSIQQFGRNPLSGEVADEEQRLQTFLVCGQKDEIQPAVAQLSEEVFWAIYAKMYNPLMHVGLAQIIFERHFAAVRGNRWLDVGAGTGIIANAGLRQGCHVTAIEPHASMRQYMVGDAQTVESGGLLTIVPGYFVPGMILEAKFDHVVMRYVMYFFEDYLAALETIYRHLKVGGTVAISNPLPRGSSGEEFQTFLLRRRREIESLPLGWRLGIYDALQARLAQGSHLFDADRIIAMMREVGFRISYMELFEEDTALFVIGEKR